MSWVEAELREQPAALERFLAAESAQAPEIVRGLLREDVRYLLIVSRGSSSNVARYMQYLFGTVNRLPVAFATPSLYTVYDAPPEHGDDVGRRARTALPWPSPTTRAHRSPARRTGSCRC